MSQESAPGIAAPSRNATVLRYREGWVWGMFGASSGLCVFVGMFVWALLNPSGLVGDPSMFIPWAMISAVGPFALLGLVASVVLLLKPTRLYLDERGLWWKAGTFFPLITWEELYAVRVRDTVPAQRDSAGTTVRQAKPSGLRLFPDDERFVQRHSWFMNHKIEVDGPDAHRWPVSYLWPMPGQAAQRLTRVIVRYRPGLVH